MQCYQCKATFLQDLCNQVKCGIVNSDRSLNDAGGAIEQDSLAQLKKLAEANGVYLDKLQIAALELPNTAESTECFAWMEFYFEMVGDQIPNSNGEIHLEPTKVKDIYEEYVAAGVDNGQSRLQITQFCKIWKSCFPHVRIREFKAVTGKCHTCATLSNLRQKARDNASKTYMTLLHFLHRTCYMGERVAYARRGTLAMQMPTMYLSIVSDGMAQNHCILPWLGNLSQVKGLPQHLQGVLRHGRGLTLYRTFHNVSNGGNLQIHTFLLTLEQVLKDEGKLPDTVFYQIDGGSENTSKTVLLLCELLIVRGLTKKIVLTRLMVGHTHSDIDAVFGRLWTAIRNCHVHTQEAYRDRIIEALSTEKYDAEVVDIYSVPDYDAILLPFIDVKFGRYCKQEHTQLQFTFEAVAVSDDFPLGCKTTYRAYSENDVIEIVNDATAQHFGLKPRQLRVKTCPPKTNEQVEGKCYCFYCSSIE